LDATELLAERLNELAHGLRLLRDLPHRLVATGERPTKYGADDEAQEQSEEDRHGTKVTRGSDRNGPVASYGVSLTIGIVGLPNVGKSTLFNALTKNDVLAANYPFATIEPNVGVVAVPDPRVAKLAEVFSSERQIAATVSFVDIAGIVRGASEGAGLGN